MDVAADNATLTAKAIAAFTAFPPEIKSCLGAPILLHNPDMGSVENRAKHVSHFKSPKTGLMHPDPDKCRWLPSIPETIAGAAAVLSDFQGGSYVFARKYATGPIHFVVVRVHRPRSALALGAGLITQFSHTPGGRQEAFRLHWIRRKKEAQGRSLGL